MSEKQKHIVGVIERESAQQKRAVILASDKALAAHLTTEGWLDCSKGAQMFWVHPDLRSPIDGDQCFVSFEYAVEIQSRWELNWPDVRVSAVTNYEPTPAPEIRARLTEETDA